MTRSRRASVVVAVEHSDDNLPMIVSHLDPAAHPEVDFIFCGARPPGAAPPAALAGLPANVRWLACPAGLRIPHLWRDGILAARTDTVALLSAHCIPAPGWTAAVLALTLAPADAGIGGYLSNAAGACARDWAIYLLRYVNYSRPRSQARCSNIAADNAVYRRSEIVRHPKLLERGFWEPEFHREFFARGLELRLVPTLHAVHRNRYTAAQFAHQRRDHGTLFGTDRARARGTGRLVLYVLAAPLIAFVLLAKVYSATARLGWRGETPAGTGAWLFYFTSHWAFGEARGLVCELLRRTGMKWCKATTHASR